MNKRFPKQEKLKDKLLINQLFRSKTSFSSEDIRVLYLDIERGSGLFPQVCFSVPKRLFKKAVIRNRIKRQMRESYRLQKFLLENNNKALLFIFVGTAMITYESLSNQMEQLLRRISARG